MILVEGASTIIEEEKLITYVWWFGYYFLTVKYKWLNETISENHRLLAIVARVKDRKINIWKWYYFFANTMTASNATILKSEVHVEIESRGKRHICFVLCKSCFWCT